MKLEFLDDLTDNGKFSFADPDKLIRLYDFNYSEAAEFKAFIDREIIVSHRDVDVSSLRFINCVNCTLKFQVSDQDYGIVLPKDKKSFICRLTLETYKRISEIIVPFNQEEVNGFNWLYDPKPERVDLLFSPGGTW